MTFREPVRICAGYVPQEEGSIYQSKCAQWRKEMTASQEMPPGYDPALDGKPKTKLAKRNERKKEKRLQAALEKDKNSAVAATRVRIEMVGDCNHGAESVASMTAQLDNLTVSTNGVFNGLSSALTEDVNSTGLGQDIDERVRALKKKKICLAKGQQWKNGEKHLGHEQKDKPTRLDGWREELNILVETG